MIGKRIFGLMAAAMTYFVLAWPLAAAEKTFQIEIPGCSSWSAYSRIGSILKRCDGVISYRSLGNSKIEVTLEDQKTDEEKIVTALLRGGVKIPGKQLPEAKEE